MKLSHHKAVTLVSSTESDADESTPTDLERLRATVGSDHPLKQTRTERNLDFTAIIDAGETEGFKMGATVVRKREIPLTRLNPLNWGLIIECRKFWSASLLEAEPKPYKVRWATGHSELHNKEDLYVMNPVPSYPLLRERSEYMQSIRDMGDTA